MEGIGETLKRLRNGEETSDNHQRLALNERGLVINDTQYNNGIIFENFLQNY